MSSPANALTNSVTPPLPASPPFTSWRKLIPHQDKATTKNELSSPSQRNFVSFSSFFTSFRWNKTELKAPIIQGFKFVKAAKNKLSSLVLELESRKLTSKLHWKKWLYGFYIMPQTLLFWYSETTWRRYPVYPDRDYFLHRKMNERTLN